MTKKGNGRAAKRKRGTKSDVCFLRNAFIITFSFFEIGASSALPMSTVSIDWGFDGGASCVE